MDKIIYTTFFCVKCEKSITTKGKHSWMELGEVPQELSGLHFVTFVKCWSCAQIYVNPIIEASMKWTEVPTTYLDKVLSIHSILCPKKPEGWDFAMMYHIILPGEGPSRTLTLEDTNKYEDTMVCPIMHMDMLRKRIDYQYEAMTVKTDISRIVDAYPNFITKGPTVPRKENPLRTPMIVHNIFFCPACLRNVIYTGYISLTPLLERIYEDKNQAIVYTIACRRCKDLRSLSDPKICELMLDVILKDSYVIDNIGRAAGVTPSMPRPEQLDVFHRVESMNQLGHMCDVWSAIDGKKSDAYQHFI